MAGGANAICRAIGVGIIIATSLFGSGVAKADSDKLPFTFDSIAGDFRKALTKVSVKERLTKLSCLDGDTEKRTVCTYRLGPYMGVMAETEVGQKDIVGVTMMCATSSKVDALKCILAFTAAISASTPGIDIETRGKILKVLLDGLAIGNETTITTDERKFTLQKSLGLWLHIFASDADQ